jgi:hypothetical protein
MKMINNHPQYKRVRTSVTRVLFSGCFFAAFFLVNPIVAMAAALPTVSGFDVSVHSTLSLPMQISFAPSGTMFVGNGGNSGSGVFIRQVSPDGSTVTNFGDTALLDPDAVLFDGIGVVADTPGSVLVGASNDLFAVRPNGTTQTIFSSDPTLNNIQHMTYDNNGDLMLGDFVSPGPGYAARFSGGTLDILYSLADAPAGIAVNSTGSIFTVGQDGIVRVHTSDGTLVDSTFASFGGNNSRLEFGPGGDWGTDLYAVAGSDLYRIDGAGNTQVIGTGFGGGLPFLAFHSGDLFVSEFLTDRVLRISPSGVSPIPEPSTFILAVLGLMGLFGFRRRQR